MATSHPICCESLIYNAPWGESWPMTIVTLPISVPGISYFSVVLCFWNTIRSIKFPLGPLERL